MRFVKWYILCVLSFTMTLNALILQVDDLKRLEEESASLGPDDLVLWDVDETLICPCDAILQPHGEALFWKIVAEARSTGRVKHSDDYLISKLLRARKIALIDPHSLVLISKLQAQGVPTLGFTAADSGPLGTIENMADWRIEELKELGFDFHPALPHIDYIEWPKLEGKSSPPAFKRGILFTSDHPKGEILPCLLEHLAWRPKRVFFIDDRIRYVESVDNALSALGIDSICFLYRGAAKNCCAPLNEQIARLQVFHLAEKGEWLSDAEAEAQLATPL